MTFATLSIDPGAKGGAAFWLDGSFKWSLPVDCGEHRMAVLGQAWSDAGELPLVIVAETWTPHGKMGFNAALGLGAQWGRWQERIDELPPVKVGRWQGPKIVKVKPGEWRRAVFGSGWGNKPKAEWSALALQRVKAMHGVTATDDEAVAVLIGEWATKTKAVQDVLPVKFRRSA